MEQLFNEFSQRINALDERYLNESQKLIDEIKELLKCGNQS